ncbi:MAG: decaprenyl-phosphate phosphoribosyltransferase [Candidatus Latescibacterota bacterium]|nr:MAG: decaprenyl-phosphate phosphoribosyltransferase [Candidatus Latescibacterota bacterium]
MKRLYYIIVTMRPRQWTKNLVLFAGLIFSQNIYNMALVWKSVQAFLIFCALSGVIYLVNDVTDVEKDKLHEDKRKRPLPSGKLGSADAIVAAVAIGVVALGLAYRVGQSFFNIALVFFFLNILYSIVLKKIVLLDVVSISLSFVIRAIAGVEALVEIDHTIELSPWLLICTLFLSLFLAFCKRRHELTTLGEASRHREALAEYSPLLIDQLVGISAAGAVLSYSIYTIWPDTVEKFGTSHLVYTIPLVLIGVMRYLYLVYSKDKGGSPTEMLLSEKFILIDVFLWILLVIAIFHVF